VLVGRQAELARLGELLAAAREGRSGALVITGEAGIGKTALCQAAVDMAEGMQVIRARGVASESELLFAGLTELFGGAGEFLPALPDRQRAAMEGALAIGPPASADPFAVRVATLGLLAALAEEGPLLCIVDDLQWVDASSAQALTFAARRVQAEGIAMLFAARPGDESADLMAGLDRLPVEGLSALATSEVLSTVAGAVVDADVARSLHRSTGGNPLALAELPGLLSPSQLLGAEPLPDPLPAGPMTDRAFRRRIAALGPETRAALVAAAATGTGELSILEPALGQLGLALTALEPAEEAGIILVTDGRVEFLHPLIRSAAYYGALAPSRRRAHAAIAASLADGDTRRPWHLGAAALGPDAAVADALAASAVDARRRGGHVDAASALERSAQLTPDPDTRARRLGEAAVDLNLGGRPARAVVLAAEAMTFVRDDGLRADLELVHSAYLILIGQPENAYRRLMSEAAEFEATEPWRAAILQMAAVAPCYLIGDGRTAYATAERAHASAHRVGGALEVFADAVLAQALVIRGDAARGRELLAGCLTLLSEADPLWGPHLTMSQAVSISYMWIEQYDTARRLTDRSIEAGRAAGAPGLLPFPLSVLAELDFRVGGWDRSYSLFAEGLELADQTGQAVHLPRLLAGVARIEALRGQDAACRAHVDQSVRLAAQLGASASAAMNADEIIGLLEFSNNRIPEALACLDRLAGALADQDVGEPSLLGSAPERIEALIRLGRAEHAREALGAFERQARATGGSWAQAAAARCHGLLAEPDDCDGPFTLALSHHADVSLPFEQARTELCYGERLRRSKRRRQSRQHLGDALEVFRALQARPWADRAEKELAATGTTARRRVAPGPEDQLTPQELRVAIAIAEGASNREAAAALFLSAKTIEFHLASVYRKLGIRSRSELARRYASP
jgi:DNA-binding CsgD family transcriptional regulator